MKLCTCTRTCKRLGCCHLLYICLTQNLLHSNFKPLQNLNEISLIFVAIGICCCCFLFFFEGREKMARRPYVSPEALYSSIMDSVGYPEIYSLKRKYLPIFQSHRIKPIKPIRHRIYAIADSAQTEYCSTFHCSCVRPCVRVSQA